ncbi:MAG TPA: alkaline phosphatase family protein, partial [Mycobacteriales bacterium]|nr:alkaline phosphatase family protein [Mycobacteriales bacterium]
MARLTLGAAAALLALGAACSSSSAPSPTAKADAALAAAPAAVTVPASAGRAPTKLLVIVEENEAEVPALAHMPYLASQARRFGYTTHYHAITHPSLPNYLAIAGGSTFGVTDDGYPSSHPASGRSIFDQALAVKRRARTYAESMPGPCTLVSAGRYAVKHNPWAYFTGSRAACRQGDVPAGTTASGALRTDVRAGRLPAIGLVIPDICDDGHDCALSTSDAWLRGWLPVIMAGPDWTSGKLAIVITFDEDDHSDNNRVLTVVLS